MENLRLVCGVYTLESIFSVQIARNASVEQLQQVIVDAKKDVDQRFRVDPSMVNLYLARATEGWLQDNEDADALFQGEVSSQYPKMRITRTLDDIAYFEEQPPSNTIHVLVKLPVPPQPERAEPQVNWTVAPEPCHRLTVRAKDRLIQLPPSYIDGTGIGDSDRPLILYRRAPLIKQWNEMNRCSIQTYALLRVVGPPGTGKSCAALAFAWSLKSSHWDVIWIHYSRHSENFNCVWLHGGTKATCVIGKEMVERDLAAILDSTSATTRTIVFLNGYVKASQAAESARLKCKGCHQRDVINHRYFVRLLDGFAWKRFSC